MAGKPNTASNRFGSLLDRFCVARGLSLHQAGRLLGQHHSVLSSVIRGVEPLSRNNLQKLTDRMAKNWKALGMTPAEAADMALDLQIAWLEDMALPTLSERLAVVRRRMKAVPTTTDPRLKALTAMESASAASPELADWLIATASILGQIPTHGRVFRRKKATASGNQGKR